MSPDHAAFLADLRAAARPIAPDRSMTDSYGGSGHLFYNVAVPVRRAMVKRWLAAHGTASAETIKTLVGDLFAAESHEEKTLGALLLRESVRVRRATGPAEVDAWLGHLNGWAEIDSLCQNAFTAEEMLAGWPAWERLLVRLSKDANINKRRAALVLLTGPVHYSDDPRFRDLALIFVARLSPERDILITKAISWLLRCLVTRHRAAVERCLAEQAITLPKVAIRETRVKLATGTKSGRGRAGSAPA
jgi:3-methyladenine DNA glycosylase AlkD